MKELKGFKGVERVEVVEGVEGVEGVEAAHMGGFLLHESIEPGTIEKRLVGARLRGIFKGWRRLPGVVLPRASRPWTPARRVITRRTLILYSKVLNKAVLF